MASWPNDYRPVVSARFLKERLDAITVGKPSAVMPSATCAGTA
jgi:hypothetical protein